jgi:regulator of protease activity HflC (stomatin/prohibitin superfamily)
MIINAEGEFQASQKLSDAARIISTEPAALQLRYLQAMSEIAAENNSTLILPVPIDLLQPFINGGGGGSPDGLRTPPARGNGAP